MIKKAIALVIPCLLSVGLMEAQTLGIQHLSTYESGIFATGGSEIVAFDPMSQRAFSTNGALNQIDILNLANVNAPTLISSINLNSYGGIVNSVAVYNGIVAAAVQANVKTDNGSVIFFDTQGNYINQVTVGALPDMLAFSPNGNYLVTANEGEPNDAYTIDPLGTVSIIDMTPGAASLSNANVTTLDFSGFNGQSIPGLRVFGPNATLAQDVEPEYVAFNSASDKVFVILQENNAVATIDLSTSTVTSLKGLGFKDWSLFQLDASNTNPAINFSSYSNLFGMYQPDAIHSVQYGSKNYIVTANEGDARDYAGFSEEDRVRDLSLDAVAFPNAANLKTNDVLGRLNVTNTLGDANNDGNYEALYAYGARSFSIVDPATGRIVFDSGDEIEMQIAQAQPAHFNSTHNDNTSFKNRSDDKGPEPESITVGEINGNVYAFVGMERQGGIMCFNITDTANVTFEFYFNNRNWNMAENAPGVGDLGPEDLKFIPAAMSPNGQNLILMAAEISGTVSVYQVNTLASDFNLTIFHNNDGESKLTSAGGSNTNYGGAARFSTLLDTLRNQATQMGREHILLSSGDNFLAGPEFAAGLNRNNGPMYDAMVLAHLNYDAICLGNHDFDFGPTVLDRMITDVNGINPTTYLSANLDFSAEPALNAQAMAGRLAKSTVVVRGTESIGIVGATTPSLPNISSPGNTILNPNLVAAVQAEVDSMVAMGINKIILIAHLQGIGEDTALVPMLRNVDVVIAGGGDELLGNSSTLLVPGDGPVAGPYPLVKNDADGNPVYIVTTPGEYKYVGSLSLSFDANGVVTAVDSTSAIKRVADLSIPGGVAADPYLQANVIDSVSAYVADLGANLIGSSQVALDGRRNTVRGIESNLGNLVADAMLWQANKNAAAFGAPQATIGIQNGGGIRNNNIIAAGPISELNTYQILPFSNFVSIVEGITPARFKEFVENSVSASKGGSNSGNGRFAQISGFSFVWDTLGTSLEYDVVTNALITAGQRIWEIRLDDGTYIVRNGEVMAGAPTVNFAIADFSAKGGDQYPLSDLPMTTVGATYQQALFNYITAADGLNGLIDSISYPENGEGRISYRDCSSLAIDSVLAIDARRYNAFFSLPSATRYALQIKAESDTAWNTTRSWTNTAQTSQTFSFTLPGQLHEVRLGAFMNGAWSYGCSIELVSNCKNMTVNAVERLAPFCPGDSAQLKVNVFGGFKSKSFVWNTGATTQFIYGQQGQKYWVTATDEAGCTETDTVVVSILDRTAFTPNNFQLVKNSATQFTGTWDASSLAPGVSLIGYRMGYRRVGTNGFNTTLLDQSTTAMVDFTGSGLASGNYEFVVFARVNDNGNVYNSAYTCIERKFYNGIGAKGENNTDGLNASAQNLSLYPNPANEVVYVSSPAEGRLTLVDVQGKTLFEGNIEANNELAIQLDGFAAGVYVLQVQTAHGIESHRIVKK